MKSITQYRILRALSHTALSARVLMVVVLAGVLTSACDVHGITAPGTLASMTCLLYTSPSPRDRG